MNPPILLVRIDIDAGAVGQERKPKGSRVIIPLERCKVLPAMGVTG
jgi:hypothetical protein